MKLCLTEARQLFQNLLTNALKFVSSERTPRIEISVEDLGDKSYKFSIRDNGIGIEKEFFERIFTVFQRLHTREEFEGTGIGLALCRKIVRNHKGEIWLESTPGEGTTFYFTLNNVYENS